ncbi:NifB/NifX family molybdenum-iron cluster-binding protein [Rhodospira trueperi]|uniref:Predicted Fe-Mo cluster-binding protein, NifX family n=1 Tax=Rhodospira trueperi TaxID=69960 RepID=A0A1G7EP58_9PROT|nr:NifB/NifX family molybdenum-iron cluster-binding protein [Rhodospira trueperi]SDE65387.1 Predicted Fe-Mo cluster-binding protein, NifX family [Rhodospira trueperi]
MKIAFTTTGPDLASAVDPRFGRAAHFLIFDTETDDAVLIDNDGTVAAQGAGIKAAETIVRAGATVLITGECGPKATGALHAAGTKIYSAKSMSVSEALAAFRAGRLTELTAA